MTQLVVDAIVSGLAHANAASGSRTKKVDMMMYTMAHVSVPSRSDFGALANP